MFWHNLARSGPSGLRRTLVAAAFGLLFLFGSAAPASAGYADFCTGSIASNQICTGATQKLTASRGWNNSSQGGVGCGGEAYGYYTCATPAGCMAYNGAALRTPAIRHRAATSRVMMGYMTWGSTPQPAYCTAGSQYRAAGPVTGADPTGVPVLDERAVEEAPEAVADLWPNADPERARHFSTPTGDGWVLALPTDRKVCVAVEVPDTGYGFGCQSYNQARLQGSVMTIEDSDLSTAKGDLVVALPAEGSAGLEITRRDGSVRTVKEVDGVAVALMGSKDDVVALEAAEDSGLKAQRFSVGK